MNQITAIVPMRHSSERVPKKNYRPFAGKPLFHYIIKTLISCPKIDEVVIDTDSPVIIEDAKNSFPEVRILERPEHLRDGSIAMNDVLLNSLSQIDSKFYLQTHSTNPLLTVDSVVKAVDTFEENYPMYDSLFAVTRLQTRLWDSLGRAVNHNPNILLRTQDLPPIFEENSCLYIFSKEVLEQYHNRIGKRPLLFEIPGEEAQDIDVELDFKLAEFLYKQKHES